MGIFEPNMAKKEEKCFRTEVFLLVRIVSGFF
jgi:hypothetical protein